MRRILICWLGHCLATVAGWYFLSAVAQGVVDSGSDPTPALILFNIIIQILCFPLVLAAMWLTSIPLGGFSPGSFAIFALLAAANSALVVAGVAALARWLRGKVPAHEQ